MVRKVRVPIPDDSKLQAEEMLGLCRRGYAGDDEIGGAKLLHDVGWRDSIQGGRADYGDDDRRGV